MDAGSLLGLVPGGLLIAGGCAVYLYTRHKYPQTVSEFDDLERLEQHLATREKRRSLVIVEGTVAKLAENSVRSKKAGIEGAARKVFNVTRGKATSDVSVPFLLV